MKRFLKRFGGHKFSIVSALLVLVAAVTLGGAGVASAHKFYSGDNVSVSSGKPIDNTVFAAGRNVYIGTEVFGDVFAAGQTVNISGPVHGDVIAAGQTITVSGAVTGDVRLAGQTISLSAPVSGNATVTGQSFTLDSKGSIGGDATVGATDTNINGDVKRDVAIGGDNAVIAGSVGRDVATNANHLRLSSSAKVAGNVRHTSTEEVKMDKGAVVTGKVTRIQPTEHQQVPEKRVSGGFVFAWFLYCLIAMALLAVALALLIPGFLEQLTDRGFPRPWLPLLVGFLAGIVAPMLILILALSLVGLPLAFLLGTVCLLILMLSGPVFAYYIGRMLFHSKRHAVPTMLAGSGILLLLYFIPFINVLAVLAATWIGSGLILMDIYSKMPRPEYDYSGNPEAKSAPAPKSRR